MKIIHLTHGQANPSRMNGVGVVVHQLASAQARLGHDVEFWGISGSMQRDFPERPFQTHLFPKNRWRFWLDSQLGKQIKAAGKLFPKPVFHLHGGLLPEIYRTAKCLVAAQIPYIFTPHGALSDGAFRKNYRRKMIYLNLFDRFVVENALFTQALGESERVFMQQHCPKARIKLIPNGQAPLCTETEWMARAPIAQHPHFVFCGRLDRYHKGLDLTLDGFHLFLQKGGSGTLTIIGDGPDRVFLENKTRELGLQAAVVFTGALFGAEKLNRMRQADTFLHTSRMEGFPMAVLEAAALGVPCLVSEATNTGVYIRAHQAGWVLAQNDPAHIAQAFLEVQKAYFDKKLPNIGHNALKMIQDVFSWEAISQQLLTAARVDKKVLSNV